ncbi:MAG: hypothetical protein JJE04_04925 [Acidobacteriia bacterium]|nr:hypothetical protein [Terriglobia bacterium]
MHRSLWMDGVTPVTMQVCGPERAKRGQLEKIGHGQQRVIEGIGGEAVDGRHTGLRKSVG